MANFKTINVELTERECAVISLAVDILLDLINERDVHLDLEDDSIVDLHNDLVSLQVDGFTLLDEAAEMDESEEIVE